MSYINSVDVSAPEPRRQLAFQFRLRTLMYGVAGCSVLMATMMYVGPFWSLAITFVVMIVGAHIAGNAIGTALRSHAAIRPARRIESMPIAVPDTPKPHLQHRTRLGKLAAVFTLAGAVCGVLVGGLVFSAVDRDPLTIADWLLGLASFAVIAGWLGFMASSFFRVGFLPAVGCFFTRHTGDSDEQPVV